MSNISDTIFHLRREKALPEEQIKEVEKYLTDKAYKESNLVDLVNRIDIDITSFCISKLKRVNEDDVDETGYIVKTFSRYSPLLDDTFRTEEEYDEAILSYMREEEINLDDFHYANANEQWSKLEKEYDEAMYGFLYKIGSSSIDYDLATESNLTVVEVAGNEFLTFIGCGTDMSHTLMKYIIRKFLALPKGWFSAERFIENLKNRSSEEEFKELMEILGVDMSRISK